MASSRVAKGGRAEPPAALDRALEQSHDVRVKVETCAEDLASTNESMKAQIAGGTTLLSARRTLRASAAVEGTVQEVADDLHEVAATLAKGIDDLPRTETALTESREILAETRVALALSQEDEREARRRALHDSMTGLPNRELFDDRLVHAIALAQRHDWTLAVMFLDLNEFKAINDAHGHASGDAVLRAVARRLSLRLREEDALCRNGGDEFLYLLVNPQGKQNLERIVDRVATDISEPLVVGNWQITVHASIGVAVYPHDGATGDELVKSADAAMYRAKSLGRGCVFFDSESNSAEREPCAAGTLRMSSG